MITGKSGAAQVGRLAPRHIDLANTDVNDRPGQAWMRVDLRTTWRRTRPGKSDERGRALDNPNLATDQKAGRSSPSSAPPFPQVTSWPLSSRIVVHSIWPDSGHRRTAPPLRHRH